MNDARPPEASSAPARPDTPPAAPRRPFGAHGFDAPALGLGAGPLGAASLEEDAVDRVLGSALERGVTLIDTAPSYGRSEERLGRHLEGRREGVLLSTKLGYGVEGAPDWTGECIRRGVHQALRRLRTERLALAFLHSCPPETLAREDVLAALRDAVEAGDVRVAGYSGDGPGLRAAKREPLFGAFQVSHNLVDQEALEEGLPAGAGVLAKRPLLNAVFAGLGDAPSPDRLELRQRFERLPPALRAPALPGGVAELALRFAAFAPGVHTTLVGTTRPAHLEANLDALARGPLPASLREAIRGAWAAHRWPGLV